MDAQAYSELAAVEAHHWWYQGMREITADLLQKHLPQTQDLAILDAGCGVGGNLTALARFGQVWGMDFSALAVAYAQSKHPQQVAQASVEALPYADASFDLVTSFDVLYHRGVRDDVEALREFARVLKPKGYVLVRLAALPLLRGAHDTFVHGARRYTATELRQKMEAARLKPLRLTYVNSLLLPLILPIRLWQRWRNPDEQHESDVGNSADGFSNRVLVNILRLENQWLQRGGNFAAGVSVIGFAQKA